MNSIFLILVSASLALSLSVSPSALLSAISTAGVSAISLCGVLCGVYAFWMGIIAILEKTPALSKLDKIISPITKKLFPLESEKAMGLITMNITANILGIGSVATPLGIEAVKEMQSKKTPEKITNGMIMFFILNATSLQILPTTIISLRSTYGSASPSSILVPTLVASGVSTMVGVGLVLVGGRRNL